MLQQGTFGVLGGCTLPTDPTRSFEYDANATDEEYWAAEVKLRSAYEGPINFVLGANYLHDEKIVDARFISNVQAQLTRNPTPFFATVPLYPAFDHTFQDQDFDSYSAFGELYWQIADSVRLTVAVSIASRVDPFGP